MNPTDRPASLPDREEAIRILQSGFGREILMVAANYVAPIYWGDPGSLDDNTIRGNGSIFFLDLGGPVLGVTCDHVIDGWLQAKEADPHLSCQILNSVIDPEPRIISRDPVRDLATMEFTVEEVAGLNKWVHRFPPDNWPPGPPQEGRGVFFAGFPGNRITQVGDRMWEFGIYGGLGIATSVAEDRVVYQMEREHLVDTTGLGLPPPNEFLGGMSGAPLWAVITHPGELTSWRLAGVIYEWSTNFELLYARRPDALLPDGNFSP